MSLEGNKGEWSEPYVLLKLIADGNLYVGDENYEQLEDTVYPILKLLRHEKDHDVEFKIVNEHVIIQNKDNAFEIPILSFMENAEYCFDKIISYKPKKGEKKGAFSIPKIESFLNSFAINSLKAKSKLKNDISIKVNDPNTVLDPKLGFSIKSQLGRPSTLLNASKATRFEYEITDKVLSQSEISEINNTKLFSEKFELLNSFGANLSYCNAVHPVFRSNLQTIDYHFDKILADMLLMFSSNNDSSENTVPKFINKITRQNKIGYDLEINSSIYELKMKNFLTNYALGMRAAEVWRNEYQASGGYLIVRKDGELICYHFYFREIFESYLYNNTKLETPDKRNDFGHIYIENGVQKMKLCLQIRFIV